MDDIWNEQLVEKLTNLNISRDSIEVVSQWCIFYRNKAKAIVETWCREFQFVEEGRQIPFLYLANDIILNCKKTKGCQAFLDEFWQVLPKYLKDINRNGGQFSMEVAQVVSKLVDLWEEGKAFGSGHHNLRKHFLGESWPSSSKDGSDPMFHKKRKLEVNFEEGSIFKKVLAAYQAADEGHIDEERIWEASESSFKQLMEMENDVNKVCIAGNPDICETIRLSDNLIQEETVLLECTNHLQSNEKGIKDVISQLKEAIQQEENKWDTIRDQLKDAQSAARRLHAKRHLHNISNSSHEIYNQGSTESTQIEAKGSFNQGYGPRNL